MGRAALTEVSHIVAQIATVALFAWFAAWAVPQAGGDIWTVAGLAMVAVAFMGVRPLRLAAAADRAERNGLSVEEAAS